MRRHYLQLNGYRRVLLLEYGIVVARMCVIVFSAAMDDWAEYHVPFLDDEVEAMFRHGLRDVPPPAETTAPPVTTAGRHLGELPVPTRASTHARARADGLPPGVRYIIANRVREDRPWENYAGGVDRVAGLVEVDHDGYLRCCAGGTTAGGKRKPCRVAEEWDIVRGVAYFFEFHFANVVRRGRLLRIVVVVAERWSCAAVVQGLRCICVGYVSRIVGVLLYCTVFQLLSVDCCGIAILYAILLQ